MSADGKTRLSRVRAPFRTAEAYLADEITDPRDTRLLLCEFAKWAAPPRKTGPSKFHLQP